MEAKYALIQGPNQIWYVHNEQGVLYWRNWGQENALPVPNTGGKIISFTGAADLQGGLYLACVTKNYKLLIMHYFRSRWSTWAIEDDIIAARCFHQTPEKIVLIYIRKTAAAYYIIQRCRENGQWGKEIVLFTNNEWNGEISLAAGIYRCGIAAAYSAAKIRLIIIEGKKTQVLELHQRGKVSGLCFAGDRKIYITLAGEKENKCIICGGNSYKQELSFPDFNAGSLLPREYGGKVYLQAIRENCSYFSVLENDKFSSFKVMEDDCLQIPALLYLSPISACGSLLSWGHLYPFPCALKPQMSGETKDAENEIKKLKNEQAICKKEIISLQQKAETASKQISKLKSVIKELEHNINQAQPGEKNKLLRNLLRR